MKLLTRREAAAFLRVPASTLAQWAYQHKGPRYFRVGRRCLYDDADLIAFLREHAVEPTKTK